MNSNFSCNSAEAEKNSSLDLRRLSGTELRNTYTSILSTSVWQNLASQYYLLPSDNLDGQISNFVRNFTVDTLDQISRFNQQVALQVISSNAHVSAFFGNCSSLSLFPRTCFDSFMNTRGPLIFRSALNAEDRDTIWASINQATTVPDQLATLVQILLNDPRFLYHIELGEGSADPQGMLALSSYEIANRIAYGMTSAPADSALWADAGLNKLKNLSVISAHIDRIAMTAPFKNRVQAFI